MKISIVAVMDQKRGIGKDNKIPWHIKEDLVLLKNLTKDHVVILGRKTYESMVDYYNKSGRPMPGKLYIVVTRNLSLSFARPGLVKLAGSLEDAIEIAKETAASAQGFGPLRSEASEPKEVFVIGGAQIFQQAIPIADKLYLTIVEDPPAGGFNADAFFPDYQEFKKVISEETHDNGKYKFKFLELER